MAGREIHERMFGFGELARSPSSSDVHQRWGLEGCAAAVRPLRGPWCQPAGAGGWRPNNYW